MATRPATVAALLVMITQAGDLTTLRMFGEYCLYLDAKPVGLICRDRLYVKPTEMGRAVVPEISLESPFPGIRPYLLVPEGWIDGWTHRETLCDLPRATYDALPPLQLKKPRKPRRVNS